MNRFSLFFGLALSCFTILGSTQAFGITVLNLFPNNQELNALVNGLILNDNLDAVQSRQLGQGICRAAGQPTCLDIKNIGQGVCRAAGQPTCLDIQNLGQGICRAAGQPTCLDIQNLGQGICRASGASTCRDIN